MELLNCILLLVIANVLIGKTVGDFPSGAHQAVRCMLSHTEPGDCASVPKVIVPSYLLQEYNNSPSSLHEALLKNTLAQLSPDQLSTIPHTLLYLIPRVRLADLSANQLRAILQTHPNDISLVYQVAACLQHDNKMLKFFDKMNVSIPEEMLQILAQSIEISDLTEDFLKLPYIENQPLLAYLRPAVLLDVETTTLYSLYNVLRMVESKPPKKPAFYFLTEAAIKHRAPLSKLKGFVLGLSPDQLLNDSITFDVSISDFRLDLSLLQARALFERSYQNMLLSRSNFIDSKPLLYKLSPELLQKFPQNVQKYEVNFIDHITSIPLPTACQIREYVEADCILTRRLPKDDEFWGINIRHMGKWAYTQPLSTLEGYKTSALSTAVLKTLESPAISPMQAYYLTGKGEALDVGTPNSILDLENFLCALPASQLVNRKLGEISSSVKLHLVSKLPGNNLARTLSLVNKIASSLGDPAEDNADEGLVLEELLGNKDVNQIVSLLSPKDVALSAEAMLKSFADEKIQNSFSETIEQLPQQILTALLDYNQLRKASHWRWSNLLERNHISYLLVGGLTCQHIQDMDTGLFIPIMARYNAVRKKFPKNLQHCCQQKMINHLKLKMTLSQMDTDAGLISLLEPIEIESIGGNVLLSIPLDAIKVSPYLGHILYKIGQLSTIELMMSLSTDDVSKLKQVAELAVDKDGRVDTFFLRNLVWYLPLTANTPDLRLLLESKIIDTTICLPAEIRLQVAARLISVFGSPDQWSAGALAALQDLLVVFDEEQLSKVPLSSWTRAADSLVSHYSDWVDWVQPDAFYKVCSNLLGKSEENQYKNAIRRYVRWHLTGAQNLLDSVVSLPQPLDITQNYKYTQDNMLATDEESKASLTIFNPQMEMEPTDEEYETEPDETTETNTIKISTTDTSETEISTTHTRASEIATSNENEESSTVTSDTMYITNRGSSVYTNVMVETTTRKSATDLNENTNNNITSSTQENITQNITALTNEIYTTQKVSKSTSLILNDTTPDYESMISILPHETNTLNVLRRNVTTNLNDTSYENADIIEHLPCKDSEDFKGCHQISASNSTETATELFNMKTNEANEYVNGSNKNISIIETQILPKSVTLVSNNTNGTSFQNSTLAPDDSQSNATNNKISTNMSYETGNLSVVTHNKTKNDTYYKHYLFSNLTETETNDNYQAKTQSPKILYIDDEHHSSNEVKEEEVALDPSSQDGILVNSRKEKRSIFLDGRQTKLSCRAIKMVGSLAELCLTSSDISEMPDSDIADCRVEFGAMELSESIQKLIWKKIDNKLRVDGIHLLGRMLRVVSVADLWDVEFRSSEPWALESIHAILQHNNNTMVKEKLMAEVFKKNAEFSVDLLAVLGPAVCRLEPDRLKALSVVGLDLGPGCPSCLPYLALRATEELGSVESWSQHFVHSVQAIVAGLDLESWKQLAASGHKPLSGLQPAAARCLNASHLQVLSVEQIKMIPAVTLLALSNDQLVALNPEQLDAVKSVTQPNITEKMTPSRKMNEDIWIDPSRSSNKAPAALVLVLILSVLCIL